MQRMTDAVATAVRLEAEGLAVGEASNGLDCPGCHGGRSGERKFGIRRTADGVLYSCLRASCGLRGFVPTSGALVSPGLPSPREARPYWGELHELDQDDQRFFLARFGLLPETLHDNVFYNERGQYVFAVKEPRDYVRGYMVRQLPWSGEQPLHRYDAVYRVTGGMAGPKTRVFMDEPEAVTQSWYVGPAPRTIVLVEDIVSALKVWQAGPTAVALLGTHVNADKVRELAMMRPKEVVIALDKDATSEAFRIARKWGLAFPKVRVAMLQRDLKDTPAADILDTIGVSE